jgi:putative ABC transport system permease protein
MGGSWSLRAYRFLLRLYPAAFREDYERELQLVFGDQCEAEKTLLGRWACIFAAATGIVRNAPKEHFLMTAADLRYTFRFFRHNPGFTAVALATLALGIGINSALFSVVKSVLLEDLPYGKPDELVRVWVTNPKQGIDRDVTSFPRLQDWKTRSTTFQDFAGFVGARLILTGVQEPQQLQGAAVTANFFRVMGVQPILGRDFEDGVDQKGRPRVVMLGHGFWRREFGADLGIVGRQLRMSGQSCTVIGVMPETFLFPERDLDFWVPLVVDSPAMRARSNFWMNVVGRLQEGASLELAQGEMNSIAKALESENVADRDLGVALVGLKQDLTGPMHRNLLILTGAVIFVLLICCANIAGMLSARGADRERELSIRAALGAGRSRMVRQLLTEAVSLFVCGGLLGIAVAYWGLALLLRMAPPELSQIQNTHLDLAMVGFTMAVSALSGLIFGLRPAVEASRLNLGYALKSAGRNLAGRISSRRFRSALTIGEIALAMVLLSGAGLLIHSFQQIGRVQLGFDAQRVSMALIQLPRTKYPKDRQAGDFYDRLLVRLRNSPGIESAAGISSLLLGRLPNSSSFTIEGRSDQIRIPLAYNSITPEFFSTMKIPLLKGRFFTAQDHADSTPVAIINATTARRYWPNEDPIGKRFTFGSTGLDAQWLTIVGVVADTYRAGVDQPIFTESYQPLAQQPGLRMQILMRTTQGSVPARLALQAAMHELDPEQPIARFMTLETALGERIASRRFITFLLSLFAGTSLVIAGVGLYGLISYLISQRLQEFGVRLALGAQPKDLLWLVVGRVAATAVPGLALGLVGALILSQALESLLFGISRFDLGSYLVASVCLLLVCLAAAVSPTIRAQRVDPLLVMRAE